MVNKENKILLPQNADKNAEVFFAAAFFCFPVQYSHLHPTKFWNLEIFFNPLEKVDVDLKLDPTQIEQPAPSKAAADSVVR